MDDLLRDLSVGPGTDVQVGPEMLEQLGLVGPTTWLAEKRGPTAVGRRGRRVGRFIRKLTIIK